MTDGFGALHRSLTRRRVLKLGAAGGVLVALTAAGVGCGDGDASAPVTGGSDLNAVVVTTDLIPGPNRFVFALFDGEGRQVIGVPAQVRFFSGADQPQPKLVAQVDAKPYDISIGETHRHADGSDHVHEEIRGIYVVRQEFDSAGIWGIQVATADRRQTPPSGAAFTVLSTASTPAIGALAPRTVSPTNGDHRDARQICTRVPECGLHGKTIAETVGRGRPTVINFSTPAFCTSRMCGPVLDIVLDSKDRHEDAVDYVHVEIYKDGQTRVLLDSVVEWNLPTEPWAFIVDGDGKLAAKLEAILAPEELEAALKPLLSA